MQRMPRGFFLVVDGVAVARRPMLQARNGMFSHKGIDMCRRLGLQVTQIDVEWGEGVPATAFGEALRADRAGEIKAVLATHNEAATLHAAGRLAIVGFLVTALAASETAPRTFFSIDHMRRGYAANGYPYTPTAGLLNGLKLSTRMLLDEGLETVFARVAAGGRAAVEAWGLDLCAKAPELYSDTVTAVRTPDGFNASRIVETAARDYGMAFGTGLDGVAGKAFRIGHLGSMTDVTALSGIATPEMVMIDLGLDITLGSGVAAAQAVYRHGAQTERIAAQ